MKRNAYAFRSDGELVIVNLDMVDLLDFQGSFEKGKTQPPLYRLVSEYVYVGQNKPAYKM